MPYDFYTDGSALGNGQQGSRGGYGVHVPSDTSKNVSGSYPHGPQTNNRYELEAIKHATQMARDVPDSHVRIHTDSKNAKDSVTKWNDNWKSNGYKTSSGQDVKNQDLIRDIDRNVQALKHSGKTVEFEHVRGHSNRMYI
ncbi:RNase H type-1 domain-containing protein [Caenorhabditis elegans]|uniref:RNase H type-1 domain-containing protein n=1 Tax=Caenorhabditis elegans TaxID=6239 RepID=Q9XVE6_CAEEL|nr:RNase H type-1 domain-containing protein [Caenorhabditis elegans]CAB03838.1 RNase H type-1 domain-containing protein [Caenorhabditis elegans]|eukprot:NP_492581.1 RNase H [Caenorhabditis elegans]